jgi:hypothetical protein
MNRNLPDQPWLRADVGDRPKRGPVNRVDCPTPSSPLLCYQHFERLGPQKPAQEESRRNVGGTTNPNPIPTVTGFFSCAYVRRGKVR